MLNEVTPQRSSAQSKRPVRALVLAPTRELALQVSSHLNSCLNTTSGPSGVKEEEPDHDALLKSKDDGASNNKGKKKAVSPLATSKPRGPPLVSVTAIVGGMSAQKQRRILDRGVDVLVATPGRLWDILQEVNALRN